MNKAALTALAFFLCGCCQERSVASWAIGKEKEILAMIQAKYLVSKKSMEQEGFRVITPYPEQVVVSLDGQQIRVCPESEQDYQQLPFDSFDASFRYKVRGSSDRSLEEKVHQIQTVIITRKEIID